MIIAKKKYLNKGIFLILSSVLCIVVLISCKKRNPNEFLMKGNIENLDSAVVYVTHLSADTLVIDTIVSENGKFRYRKEVDTLTVYSLYLNNYESSVLVFADRGNDISIEGDARESDLIEVRGNEVNDELTQFKKENADLLSQRSTLIGNLKKIDQSDASAESKSLTSSEELAHINSLNHQLTQQAENFIKAHPTQMSSLVLISDFFANVENPLGLEKVLSYMQGEVMKTRRGYSLKAFSDKINRSAEGASMPYFHLKDKKNKSVKSGDFLGKYLLMSFVSASGEMSREAIAKLKKSYKSINKDSIEFLTIYVDSDIYPTTYLEKDSIPWKIIPEKRSWASDIVDAYNIQYIPSNILISPKGIIKSRNIPALEVVAKINGEKPSTQQ